MILYGRARGIDVVVAVALALVIVLENVLVGEARATSIVLAAACALTLAWRRSAPFLTPMMVLLAIGYAARTGDAATFDAVSQLLIWVIGAFSAGAHLSRRWSWAGWAAWVLVSMAWLLAFGEDFADLAVELILVTGPWVAGTVVRTQRHRAHLADQRAHEEARRSAVAAADERARIARELHDVVAHAVGIMVVQAGAASEVLASDPVQARRALAAVQETGRLAVDELARMLGVLREENASSRSPLPSLSRLEELVSATEDAGTPVSVVVEGELTSLGSALDASAYRIVQEALTNVVKHSTGAAAEVTISRTTAGLEIEVVNSAGTSAGEPEGTGHGLVGIQERVAVFGGRLEAEAAPSGGFRVKAWLPVVSSTNQGPSA